MKYILFKLFDISNKILYRLNNIDSKFKKNEKIF